MNRGTWLTMFCALLAGAAGGMAAQWFAEPAAAPLESSELHEALARIEAQLSARDRTMLRGTATASGGTQDGAAGGKALSDAFSGEEEAVARLLARIEQTVAQSLDKKFESLEASGDGVSVSIGSKPGKKKVSFHELSAELELSGDEETKLREVLKNTEDQALKLLVDEGQDVEDLRRELKEKSATPEGRAELKGRLTAKFISNVPGFIGLFMSHQTNVAAAIGATKAGKLEGNYRVVDPDFIDFEAFDFD